MTLLTQLKTDISSKTFQSFRVVLDDGALTTVHVAKYLRKTVRPQLVLFDSETRLLDWCQQNNIQDAINGGFFLRSDSKPLGDMWISGKKQKTVSFIAPWNHSRGSLYISPIGGLTIGPRYILPPSPKQDLLQVGPLLVQNGQSTIVEGEDIEGFSEGAHQFDDDISIGRFPRVAIGTSGEHIFTVVAEGYSKKEAGLSFQEFAEVLRLIGIEDALNLDGGSSSTLIVRGELKNKPRTKEREFKRGRPIYSAIVFNPA